jgi:hypothetical protein
MAFVPGPKLAQQMSLPRRYERGDKVASVRAMVERKMPEGTLVNGEQLLAANEALARQEARVRELAQLEAGPLAQRLEALEQRVDGLDRKLEGYGKLVERAPQLAPGSDRGAPVVAETAGASPVEGEGEAGQRLRGPSPPKPWEAAGISERTWYRRKKEAGSEQKEGTGEGVQAAGCGGSERAG